MRTEKSSRYTPQEEKITQKRGKFTMKLSAILTAKSEIANEIESRIEYLNNAIKSDKENFNDSEMPSWLIEEIEKVSLKIKYYEVILKSIPDLK